MIQYLFACLLSLFLGILVSSCSMTPVAAKRAMCNTLKSEIVFSGATSDTRRSEIQSAEEPLQQHMFDRANCEPYDKINF